MLIKRLTATTIALLGLLLPQTGFGLNNIRAQSVTSKSLDTTAFNTWPMLWGPAAISADGKYTWYSMSTSSVARFQHEQTVVKSLNTAWSDTIRNIRGFLKFTDDSRFAVYRSNEHQLFTELLGGHRKLVCTDVDDFQLANVGKKPFLIYHTKDKKLVIRELGTGNEIVYIGVNQYRNVADKLYLVQKEDRKYMLLRFNFLTKKPMLLWENDQPVKSMINSEQGDIAFSDSVDNKYLYRQEWEKVKRIAIEPGVDCKGLSLESILRFEGAGKLLILKYNDVLQPLNPSVNPVKIFSYQDPGFFVVRQEAMRSQPSYLAAYNLATGKLTRLEFEDDHLKKISNDGEYALISHTSTSTGEYYWNKAEWHKDYVLSLKTGKKIVADYILGSQISSDGQWVFGQNDWEGDIHCMNTSTGKVLNLTSTLPIPQHFDSAWGNENPDAKNARGLNFYNWSEDGKSIIVYDRYDIWLLDPSGQSPPINLTAGKGRANHIAFRFTSTELLVSKGDHVILTAFDQETKNNGFYELIIGKPNSLIKLTMEPYLYHAPMQTIDGPPPPVKAKYANRWLVTRQSAEESPNLFWTNDFKSFHSVSNLYPEKRYQWFKTELIDFMTKDGIKSKAILYKPNDFDPNKKYPVLFNYYETRQSDKLNEYLYPGYTDDGFGYGFNYPMMLARGYMICRVDIHQQTIGETAHCIVDAVEGAADEIAKRPYIDSLHYGLCGASFGGYVTACLASMSHRFAAAVPISTPTDLISAYGNFPGLAEEEYENRQFGMGVSLGTDPQRYLRNSPIAYAKATTTPILIVNTIHDGNVNVQQGIEWFVSLRREGKRAWMLQYQEKSHGVSVLKDQSDLYVRMNQFFDHYLKGAPAPLWMTRGVSINDCGVKDGFEFDKEVKTPGPSKLTFDSATVNN